MKFAAIIKNYLEKKKNEEDEEAKTCYLVTPKAISNFFFLTEIKF